MYDIIIVGGGSAGWMTASTLIKEFPDKKIALIESPDIATIGVGESTIGQIRNWANFLGIKDKSFLSHTDGTYKLSIQFTDFYKKGESFHYPFGRAITDNTREGFNDWWYKKFFHPETPYTDYADCYFPQMLLANQNKLNKLILNFYSAFHFDATKFGLWLRDFYSLPRGITHIKEHITDIKQNENGEIESLNEKYKADLYIDCTGFASVLLGKTLKVPFESYLDLLPNNSAWATRIPYKNKRKELLNFTNCKAVENGWIWKIPLWSRMGSGYVYSDNFIDDDAALKQFQKHLGTDELEFRKIKFKVGIYERLWEKNVVAIGLSSGFIEPLEGNGLYSVHEFLKELIRELKRDKISQWDRDNFTYRCKNNFKNFADFVALHYVLSHRDETEYWKHIQNKNTLKEENKAMMVLANARTHQHNFRHLDGIHNIATGMHYSPTELSEEMWFTGKSKEELVREWTPHIVKLNNRKHDWDSKAEKSKNTYDFLKHYIYDDHPWGHIPMEDDQGTTQKQAIKELEGNEGI
tara:strand:+ start:1819 stop:3390 length:1572 start_codon:yes stop_codon:yes gene_type:complete